MPTAAGRLRDDELTAALPKQAWQRLSAGAGAKGQRYYDWALVSLTDPAAADPATADPTDTQCWWLLVRRNRTTGERAYYRCYSPEIVPLRELVRVAGRRWTVEESFQASEGLAGLDEQQMRCWTSWRRWTLLAMVAHALLAVIAAHERSEQPAATGLIELTCNEVRRLCTPSTWSNQPEPSPALKPGQPGDDATNTTPEPTTTSAKKPPPAEHTDLRLEY